MTELNLPFNNDDPTLPWAGAVNPNRFFNLPSDLFDPARSSVAFTNRLLSAGTEAYQQ